MITVPRFVCFLFQVVQYGKQTELRVEICPPNYTAVQYRRPLFPPQCYPRLINPGLLRLISIEKGSWTVYEVPF